MTVDKEVPEAPEKIWINPDRVRWRDERGQWGEMENDIEYTRADLCTRASLPVPTQDQDLGEGREGTVVSSTAIPKYKMLDAAPTKYYMVGAAHPETVVRWFLDLVHYWFDESLGPNLFTGMRDDAASYLVHWIATGEFAPDHTALEIHTRIKFEEWLESSWTPHTPPIPTVVVGDSSLRDEDGKTMACWISAHKVCPNAANCGCSCHPRLYTQAELDAARDEEKERTAKIADQFKCPDYELPTIKAQHLTACDIAAAIRAPSPSGVALNDASPDLVRVDFDNAVFYAFRYCLGRQTYAVSECVDILTRNWSRLTEATHSIIRHEIIRAFDHNRYGSEDDRARWASVLDLEDTPITQDAGGRKLSTYPNTVRRSSLEDRIAGKVLAVELSKHESVLPPDTTPAQRIAEDK